MSGIATAAVKAQEAQGSETLQSMFPTHDSVTNEKG